MGLLLLLLFECFNFFSLKWRVAKYGDLYSEFVLCI